MGVFVLDGFRDRGSVVPQPETVELVVLERCVCLRNEAIEVDVVCSQVDEDFERNVVLARDIRRRWRECLQSR